jgi:hypothetical protein
MNANAGQATVYPPESSAPEIVRRAAKANRPTVLADVYREDTNIAIWRREISADLKESVDHLISSNPAFHAALTTTPKNARSSVQRVLGANGSSALSEDMASLTEMFCDLFDVGRAGLRLAVLDRAMCPKFHVDRVPCRLVCTYQGVATEWLPHAAVDRTKLGPQPSWTSDLKAGLFRRESDIQRLDCGDVALLKGELWEGNTNAGLVHRSPGVAAEACRLLFSLDFCD